MNCHMLGTYCPYPWDQRLCHIVQQFLTYNSKAKLVKRIILASVPLILLHILHDVVYILRYIILWFIFSQLFTPEGWHCESNMSGNDGLFYVCDEYRIGSGNATAFNYFLHPPNSWINQWRIISQPLDLGAVPEPGARGMIHKCKYLEKKNLKPWSACRAAEVHKTCTRFYTRNQMQNIGSSAVFEIDQV